MELNKAEIKIVWAALSAHVDNTEDATNQQDMLQLLERFDALIAQEV